MLLAVSAPAGLLRQRILSRDRLDEDASEAGIGVLEHQLANSELVTKEEPALVFYVDNTGEIDVPAIATDIKEAAKEQELAG